MHLSYFNIVFILCFHLSFLHGEIERPNIVFILSDDQAWTDYGFMGHPDIKTPHLDNLAKQSVVFERGYVASPLCRPSLATMITGLYPFDHKITGNDVDGKNNRAALDLPLRKNFHKLPSFIRTLTENGYLAHQSGKWWEGSYQDGGFTHGMTQGDPKRGGRHGDKGLKIGREGMQPIKDFIDLAIKKDKPFLIWYAPFLPHTPHNPPEHFLKKYTKKGREKDVAKYYAMCEWFDQTCGELTQTIDRRNLRDKTMFIYICDNGWVAKSVNKDDPNQTQWKAYALKSKGSPYENGIRTPIMISWQGKIQPQRSPDFAHAIDIFPTMMAVAGIETSKDLPGLNLMDARALKKRNTIYGVTNSIFNMTPNNPDQTTQYLWCIEGDWKLLLRYSGLDTTHYSKVHSWDKANVQLYNVRHDPHEKKEMSAIHPEITKRLKLKITSWRKIDTKSNL